MTSAERWSIDKTAEFELTIKNTGTYMRKLLASLIIGTLALVSVNSQAATTNLLQKLSVTFKFYSGGGPTITSHGTTTATVEKTSFTSSDLIKAIAKDLNVAVSSKASLDLVTPVVVESTTQTYKTNATGKITTNTVVTLGHADSYPAIVDGSTVTLVGNLISEQPTLTGLESSVTTSKGVVTSDIKYNITTVTINTTTVAFTATGFSTDTLEPVTEFGTSFDLREGDLAVSGSGKENNGNTPILVAGTITDSFSGVLVTK